jgi:limonene-1,2-epoxide hydrolase
VPEPGAGAVSRFIDAFNKGDLDAFVATLDPEVEIHAARGLKSGPEEAREWATRAPGGVQQQVEVEELRPSGDQVLALVKRRWTWAEDGEHAGDDEMAWLFDIKDGKILRWRSFSDRDDGLAAAGLE